MGLIGWEGMACKLKLMGASSGAAQRAVVLSVPAEVIAGAIVADTEGGIDGQVGLCLPEIV